MGSMFPPSTMVPGTDLAAIDQGRISVTPLCLNLTHNDTCRALEQEGFEVTYLPVGGLFFAIGEAADCTLRLP